MTTSITGASRRAIDEVFEEFASSSTPGCALGITRGGELIEAASYGMANLEHDIPIGPRSIFHVASITKQVTAYGVTLLAQEGRLGIDDDVRRHIPEVPDFGSPITLRHLLHHTSGLRDQWDLLALAGWRNEDLVTLDDVLSLVARQQALNFEPGTEYLYCNTGYTLLAEVVTRVSGVSFREFVVERLFGPLGMLSSHIHDDHAEVVPGRTQAYEPREAGGFRISVPVFDVVGTTGLFTTIEDFALWDRNLRNGTVGGLETVADLLRPRLLNDGTPTLYARGYMLHEHAGRPTVSHGGLDRGYRAHYVRFPSEDLAIICFANVSTMRPRVRSLRVADLLLGAIEEQWPPTPPPNPAQYAGLYREPASGDVVRFVERDSGLATGFSQLQPLEPNGLHRFEDPRESGTWYRFTPGEGRTTVRQTSIDRDRVFLRTPDAPTQLLNANGLQGSYHSPELDVAYQLIWSEGDIILRRPKRADVALVDAGAMSLAVDDVRLDFAADNHGLIRGFAASTGRARSVRFNRV